MTHTLRNTSAHAALKRILRTFITCMASIMTMSLTMLSAHMALAQELPGKGITVTPIKSSIAEETFQTLLVVRALEQLGYTVNPISIAEYNIAYQALASGDATFMAAAWMPLHDHFFDGVGGHNKLYRQGIYSNNALQGYLIDKVTAEKYNITNIEQLKDPQIAQLFDSNGDGKADLTGCTPGWGCQQTIEHQMDAYALRNTVTHNMGSYPAMMADTIARYREGKPIVYYTWTPYWVSAELIPGKDVLWIQVPFSALPGDIDTRLPNGNNYGFTTSTQHIVASKTFTDQNPAAAKLFAIMALPLGDINAQNLRMRAGERSAKDIDRHVNAWIKANQVIFDAWIAQALKAVP